MSDLPDGIYAEVARLRGYIKQARTNIATVPWGKRKMARERADLKYMCARLKELNKQIRESKKKKTT
jgi:hypothetical protein